MSTFTHPIIILSDFDVEDALSSINTPDYTLASPDYSSASSRNTSPDSSEDPFVDHSASLTTSPFHDDPYMKVMQAYNDTNNKSPIPPLRAPISPPTDLPLSLVLPSSPLFDPRDFFLLKEIFPPQKRARFLSSSSTDSSAPPHVFEIGESDYVVDGAGGFSVSRGLGTVSGIEFGTVNNMSPRRTSAATARAIIAVAVAVAPMTVAVVEQLFEAKVSATLANHETLRNSTNGHGDGSHNSDTGIKGTESDEVEKYVGGLPDMIRGNVMSYQPKTMEQAIQFANDQMGQKVLTIAERQAKQKRKLEFNVGNNQGYQQQKRHNIGRAYTARPGENRESSGPNGNNNNRGNSGMTQNAGTLVMCRGVQGHFQEDCPIVERSKTVVSRGIGNAPGKGFT
ncbi:hypothetical protein Tco_0717953 [Tanacetum coccineum]